MSFSLGLQNPQTPPQGHSSRILKDDLIEVYRGWPGGDCESGRGRALIQPEGFTGLSDLKDLIFFRFHCLSLRSQVICHRNMRNSMFLCILASLITLSGAYLVDPPTTAPNDTISDCSNWVVVSSTDTCSALASTNGITLAQFDTYVGSNS